MSDATTSSDAMPIEDYLAQGGQLTSPGNVPARYRGELLRLMASLASLLMLSVKASAPDWAKSPVAATPFIKGVIAEATFPQAVFPPFSFP